MKKFKNEIISTILYLIGLIIVGALSYYYDKTPIYMNASRLWTGVTAIIIFCFDFVFYIYMLATKPFIKKDSK